MTATLERPATPGTAAKAGRWYHGIVPDIDRGGGRMVLVYEGGPRHGGGRLVGPLPHRIVRHSPDGFSWGYGGSGPAELALNLLVDALDDEAWCADCGGEGSQRYHETYEHGSGSYLARCERCLGTRTSPLAGPAIYQAFKSDHVAEWPQRSGWAISQAEILAWLAPRRAEALANWRG